MGSLELNPFLPLVADALLGGLSLLTSACEVFRSLCVEGIEADEAACRRAVHGSTAVLTALVDRIGYERCTEIALAARREDKPIRQAVLEKGLLTAAEFDELTSPESVMRLGSNRDSKGG
jgi:aspartate ammonia-lyase